MVEGEFEIVSKEGREGELTAPETIRDLAEASGCDLVAINVGSAHKMTRKAASLDLGRLEAIAGLVPHQDFARLLIPRENGEGINHDLSVTTKDD
jgi:fructose/tagatose bisphosphate aldolase